MKIGFVIDHPKRDLPGGIMVAHALAKLGVESALIPLYEQGVDVPLLGLDALVINYARPVNLDLVRGYHAMGLPVWVLDTEGGVLADDGANSPARMAAYIRDSGYARILSGYFFWGAELHAAFVRDSGMEPTSLHVTGCPRFDYAAPRWRQLLRSEHHAYVLVNANFPLVNPLFARSPEKERAVLVAAGWKADYVDQVIKDSHDILANFLQTVNAIAQAFPQRRFLVRPHPFEDAELYRRTFSQRANVVVDGQGSVLNVIHNADCLLHLNCGTSIEAILLGKLPLSMEFLNTPFMATHSSLPSRVSFRVASFEALCQALSDLDAQAKGFEFTDHHDRVIKPWFHLNDGLAADRVAAVLVNALSHGSRRARDASLRWSLASSREHSRAGQRVQALAANVLGSRATATLRARWQPARKEKKIHVGVVREAIAAAAGHEGLALRHVDSAPHPSTGLPLSTVNISPTAVAPR